MSRTADRAKKPTHCFPEPEYHKNNFQRVKIRPQITSVHSEKVEKIHSQVSGFKPGQAKMYWIHVIIANHSAILDMVIFKVKLYLCRKAEAYEWHLLYMLESSILHAQYRVVSVKFRHFIVPRRLGAGTKIDEGASVCASVHPSVRPSQILLPQ